VYFVFAAQGMLQDPSLRKTARCSYYKNFLSSKAIPEFPIQRVSPEALDVKTLIHATGFNKPFVITGCDSSNSTKVDTGKLGLVLPDRDKDLTYVSQIVGPHTPVKIIEVGHQSEITEWTLGEYASYLKNYRADGHKVLNMITLEFSSTPLNAKVQAPYFVRSLDWIDSIWPLDRRARGDYPKVQKYCLAGMAGSYTDFHIDFGGTSVWYHVLTGQKRFFLVPPTTANLRAFEKWTTSSAQADVFFGDLLGPPNQCFQFDLHPGETFIIPSGWIHAVYTPKDSLVFGGNFVHSYSILRQLQIYSIEHRTRVQKAYRFPFFRQINWYFLCTALPVAQEMYQKQAWVSMLEDSDDADYDDLQQVAATLKDPTVLLQLPYLVRSCELWYAAGDDRQEKNVFSSGLEHSDCASVAEMFAAWWDLLKVIAQRLPNAAPAEAAAAAAHTEEDVLSHIEHIRSLAELDLLNDEVVRPVFGAYEEALARALQEVNTASTAVPQTAAVKPEVPATALPAEAEPLKLKFSLKKPVSGEAASVPAPPAENTRAPTLRFTASGADGSSTASTVPAVPIAVPSAPSAATASATAAKKEKALKLTFGVAKPTAPANYNVEKSTAVRLILSHPSQFFTSIHDVVLQQKAAGRYGTRGLKLSKDFLSRTMDVEVGGEAGEDYEQEGEGSASEAEGRDDASGGSSGDDNEGRLIQHRRCFGGVLCSNSQGTTSCR
jgi:hypothetical protein